LRRWAVALGLRRLCLEPYQFASNGREHDKEGDKDEAA
jgi:hypothetical protein